MAKCGLCGTILTEGKRDHHDLDHPYEFPVSIEWEGINCVIRNRKTSNVCEKCMVKIVKAVDECVNGNNEI